MSGGESGSMFVGRTDALAHVHAALRRAASGSAGMVVVAGPAGIGKTALVGRFLAATSVDQVLHASGEEAETSLAFGVIDQLLAAVAPPPGWSPRSPGEVHTDPLVAGAALLELLGELQAAGPVVMVIDDAQWADRASLAALTFVVRRLRMDRVLTILVVRDVADPHLPDGLRRLASADATVQIRLGGLPTTDLQLLSGSMLSRPLSARAVARLWRHTEGNPLHVRALLQQVPAESFEDPYQPLPAPRSVALLLVSRLASMPAEVQDLMTAASVLGTQCRLDHAGMVAGLVDPLPALEKAIAAGLLHEDLDEVAVRFAHPLIQAAVYQQLGPVRRAQLHARAADVVEEDRIRLRHRARAAADVDGGLSAELARLGRGEATAGAWSSAAEHLTTAARLAPDREGREQLTLEALECQILDGDAGDPAVVARRLDTFTESGWRSYVLGRLAFSAGDLARAQRLFLDAWRRFGETGRPAAVPCRDALGARVAAQLAALYGSTIQGAESGRWAERAMRLAPADVGNDILRGLPLQGRAMAGQATQALAAVAELPDAMHACAEELDLLLSRGMVLTWVDDLDGARRDLTGVVSASGNRSAAFRIVANAMQALAEFRAGQWDEATVRIDLALSLAVDTDHYHLARTCHAIAALVPAARGQWAQAEVHASSVDEPGLADAFTTAVLAAMARGWLGANRGDPRTAEATIQQLLDAGWAERIGEPGPYVVQFMVLALAGTVDDGARVRRLLAPFADLADRQGRRSAQATAALVRGTVAQAEGDQPIAEQAFVTGLAYLTGLGMPFLQALLQLGYGGVLRRTGRRAAAAEHLRTAHATFTRLGAHPHVARCDRELAACGAPRQGSARTAADVLTAQELAVARLAASGITNRQVAANLVISVKTVEYHLRNSYAKLGVTSRRELDQALGPGQAAKTGV